MGNIGEIKNKTKFNNEGDKIYAFKPQPHRFLCFFFSGQKIIVTNAFYKKANKLPKNEKDRAMKIKRNYEDRVKRGDYYE
jgi:phage-related protein